MGTVSSLKVITTDASLTGWGAIHEGVPTEGTWSPAFRSNHINYLELMAVLLALKRFEPFVTDCHVPGRTDNAATKCYINKQGGLAFPALDALARELTLWCDSRLSRSERRVWLDFRTAQRIFCPGAGTITTFCLSTQGWRNKSSIGTAVPRWTCCIGREREALTFLLDPRDCSFGPGGPSTRMAEGTPLRVPSIPPDPPSAGQGQASRPVGAPSSPRVGDVEVGDSSSPLRPPVAFFPTQGPRESGEQRHPSPQASGAGPVGLARQRECLAAVGLTPGVVNCIQGARAPSTRALCDAKWKVFHKWCSAQSPGWCLPKHLLVRSFGSCRAGLAKASPTLLLWSIWLPSLLATPDTLADRSLSIPWSPFLKGVRRATATDKPLFPLWDLAVVLEGLCKPPFEPLRSADIRTLSLRTVLLVALTTTKRVRDIHALSVDQECMRFSDDRRTVWLKPNLKFVTKNLRVPEVTAKLVAFHPPPFLTDEGKRLHCLCPVRALRLYVQRTWSTGSSGQLCLL